MAESRHSLEEWLGRAASRSPWQPDDTKSGARFERVVIDGEPYVLKYQDPRDDWLLRATGDPGRCYVTLWESGMLDRLPSVLDHGVVAAAYDDAGDYDVAFGHYKAGNDLKKAASLYQADATSTYVDRVIATFGTEFFARMDRAGSQPELPVFIVGMPRSGTTLVEQILASHPQVHGAGELDYMRQITQALPERLAPDSVGGQQTFPECAAKIDTALAERIAEEHLQHLREHSASALRITDKTPSNFLRLGLIALLFPKARIIHCQRDPLDTCLSCYFLRFGQGQAFAYDLDDLGRYYRDYARLMEHWRRVLPSPLLEVPYEALVADQEGWSRRLIAFLGLDWDDRCLAFYRSERQVKTASVWQVRQPVYASSIGRWRRYAKHLGPLFAALGIEPPKE